MNTLLRLKRSQVEGATKMLARAFENDLLHIAYFSDGSKRFQQIYRLMKYSVRYCMRYGEVYTTSSKLEGIAMWLLEDPNGEQDQEDKPMRLFINWFIGKLANFRLWVGLGKRLEKVISMYEYMVSIHRELMPRRHWYLMILGVDPEFQGQGFSSRLIIPMLARIDKEQLPCYLDTSTEKNVALYEHFGFNLAKRYRIPDSDVINWSMVREPLE